MDEWLVRLLNQWAGWGGWADYVAFVFAQFGAELLAALLIVRWFTALKNPRRERHTILLAVFSCLTALGLAILLVRIHYRPRPMFALPGVFDLLNVKGATPSFPSLHAAASSALAVQSSWKAPYWGLIVWPIAFLASISRMYAGVHYLSDLLAGAILGACAAIFLRVLMPELEPALDKILAMMGTASPAQPPEWEPPVIRRTRPDGSEH